MKYAYMNMEGMSSEDRELFLKWRALQAKTKETVIDSDSEDQMEDSQAFFDSHQPEYEGVRVDNVQHILNMAERGQRQT